MALLEFGIYQPTQDLFFHALKFGGRISVPATKEFIRVTSLNKIGADWTIELTNGPYMLTLFQLAPDAGNQTVTLGVEADGVEVYSAECKVVTPSSGNENFLVGMAFDNLIVPVGTIAAKETLTLKGNVTAYVSYQIIRYDMELA